MKKNIIALSSERHSALKVTTAINFQSIKNEYLIPLVAQEFIVAASEFPVVFVKHEETGAFQVVVMLGLQPGENLFCENDEWVGLYTPRLIRNYPLSLAFKNEGKDGFIVCVDESSEQLNKEGGEALFDEHGERSNYFEKVIENMVSDAEGMQVTTKFVSDLADKGLLTANRLTIDIAGEKRNIDGLYVVDETKLNELPMEEFERLRKQGVLPAIYAHMSSLHQIPRLIKRKQALIE